MPNKIIWNAKSVEVGLDKIEEYRENFLYCVKLILDDYQGVERSLGYYDLLAGVWLDKFIHNLYTSWMEVMLGNIENTIDVIPVVLTLEHAIVNSLEVEWHRHLRGVITTLLYGKSPMHLRAQEGSVHLKNESYSSASSKIMRGISNSDPKILIVDPGVRCKPQDWLLALWSWRKYIAFDQLRYPISIQVKINFFWRKEKSTELIASGNDFFSIASSMIPLYLPVSLLEGFNNYRSTILSLPISRPQAIYSANGLSTNLSFRILMAEWRLDGTKLLLHQHGGGYGLEKKLPQEDYEIRVSDKFYTWGWRTSSKSVTPLSPSFLFKKHNKNNKILLACVDYPKVPYRLMFTPMPGTIEDMNEHVYDFINKLPDKRNLTIRPYWRDYGWGAVQKMQILAPEAKLDCSNKFASLMYGYGLVVISYIGTTLCESLAANIPTICFFDPTVMLFREQSMKCIEALKSVGIIHDSGKEAGNFIIELNEDIDGWWYRNDTQNARKKFVDNYANFSNDWKNSWEREFEAVLSS